jgi:hypothetical protein
MTFSELVPTIEMILVASIVILDVIGLIDQRRTNKLQRAYWTERKDWLARRLLRPVKPKETQKPPELKPPEAT